MGKAIGRILAWLLTACLCTGSLPTYAAPAGEAREVLAQAIKEFRQGLTNKASFHLMVAYGLDGPGMDAHPDYHRLRGFMAMSQGDRHGAAQAFTSSLRFRDDAFLSYLIGVRAISMSASPAVAYAFERAALASVESVSAESTDHDKGFGKDGTLLHILPLRCFSDVPPRPAPGKPGFDFFASKDPFLDPMNFDSLWTHKLTNGERAVSAMIAIAFQGKQGQIDPLLLNVRAQTATAAETGDEKLDAIIRQNASGASLHACIAELEARSRGLESAVRKGGVEPWARVLLAVNETIGRLYRMRVLMHDVPYENLAHAAFHLRSRAFLPALHASRRGLSQVFGTEGAWDAQRRRALASFLRQLEVEYDGLGRFQDRHTVREIASILETPDITPEKEIEELKKTAGSNLKNREALLFLVRLAGESERSRFEGLLLERDKAWDDRELLLLLRDY